MRSTALASVTAIAALALAGCGANDGGTDPPARGTDPQEAALRFAQCMREQGIDMPDPRTGAGGMVRIEPPAGADPADPRAERARRACGRHLAQAVGPPLSDEERREVEQAGLRFARCMRDQGVDVPDPGPGGQVLVGPGSGADPDDPRFERAERACRAELPAPGGERR